MKETFTQIIHKALNKKRPVIKKLVFVPARWKRDQRGRFTSLACRAYTRRLLDRTVLKSGLEQLAENITANNKLLGALLEPRSNHQRR